MPARSPASVRGKSTLLTFLYTSISKAGKAVPVQEVAREPIPPTRPRVEWAVGATRGWFPAGPRA